MNIEEKIDFTLLRNRLHEECSSPLGEELVEQMAFETSPEQIRLLVGQTAEMKTILTDASLGFPRGEMYDLREEISRIRVEGMFLDEAELFSLSKTLDYAVALERFYQSLDEQRFPLIRDTFSSSHSSLAAIVQQINRIIDKYGQLADHASPALSEIRRSLRAAQASVGKVLDTILRKAQADGILDKDASPTMREGRLVLPVPPAYKHKLGGIVHDESATGKTIFIEPQQVVEANNRIRELEGEERRERARILIDMAAWLRPRTDEIMGSTMLLAQTDFIRAKARLAIALKAIAPQIADKPLVDLKQARHPILFLNFEAQHKEVVPLTIRLQAPEQRILVISGPNAGGKSVCLKTVALLQYMLQSGLLVPCEESSTMGIFNRILIDIGDEQSLMDDLSTYSSHLRNMKEFIRLADQETLLLIDEFGSGTEPAIGGAIAEAVLTQLNKQEAFGVITTHYTNLKHFAESEEGIVNGAMLYDRGQMKPLFQLSIGQAGSSFAIEIARNIGLPEHIVKAAIDLVGEEHVDYDKQLQDIARDKRYWENKRQAIRLKEKKLEEKIAAYEEQMSGIKAKKKQLIEEAKQQASEILENSNATIERTIREIKEAKADKLRTQKARAKVEALKEEVKPATPKTFHDLKDLRTLAGSMPSASPSVAATIREHKRAFSRTLDLRGMRADEALETFIAYLDDAIMVSAGEVTILHGTGTGAVKQVVRDYLEQRNRQLRKRGAAEIKYRNGDPDRGGAGWTVIEC